MTFSQENFSFKDLYSENSYLRDVLEHYIDSQYFEKVERDLKAFSRRASGDILKMSQEAERVEPQWVSYDHWGQKKDDIIMSRGWEDLHGVAAEEGMIAIGYERKSQEYSRLHQFLKLLLFHPSSAFFTCPLAMTDGATRVLEISGETQGKALAWKHLLSRNSIEFWTAGQWMTEKSGGSDVSRTETVAELKGGIYRLTGVKWFTSAITSQMALTLAQAKDPKSGKEGLSLFFVRIRDEEGELNHLEILRLKDKLGTRAMPTAEIQLKGSEAELIGEVGDGVRNIATVLNISRLYNSVCATGALYRLLSLSKDYSQKREAFGRKISEHSLHSSSLFNSYCIANASVHFVSQLAVYLGKSETGKATAEELSLLRLMTPIAKLWTGKKAVQNVSELIESFGGAGYIEDTGLPKFLRDTQVLSIWEGTTNILSLDTLRALSKGSVLQDSLSSLRKRIGQLDRDFSSEKEKLSLVLKRVEKFISDNLASKNIIESGARSLAFALGDVFCGLLLCEFYQQQSRSRDLVVAQRFIENIEIPEFVTSESRIDEFRKALFS